MATESRPLINDEMLRKVIDTAREQNRDPYEVVEEAVGKYLASQRLSRFAEKMEQRAKALGITEEDVPRLIEEVRHENRTRVR